MADRLTDDQIAVLSYGCCDGYEGPYFAMPDGNYIWLKAHHVVDLAKRARAAEQAVSSWLEESRRYKGERDAAQQRIAELEEAIREAEWAGDVGDYGGDHRCPFCDAERRERHTEDCIVRTLPDMKGSR